MAALTVQKTLNTGVAPTFSTPTVSDTAAIGSGTDTFLVYRNTNGSTRTVTVVVPGNTVYGEATPDKVLTLAATNGELWIPLRKAYDDGTGKATVTLSATADVTVALVRVG